ncbi:Uncharacterised protein [Klebsiella pneumoniae]|nr:Uncharacterised protein [Klebsiella pneumoniae]
MNACCNALTGLLSRGIKQRQRFGRFLDGLAGLRDNLTFSEDTIERVSKKLSFQIAIANPVNGQLRRGGVVVALLNKSDFG